MNKQDKPKMCTLNLVSKLKNEKGVTFNIQSEKYAENYLKNTNNYLRTASYRKNYPKHISGDNSGKYINLDFAYLTELSTIDMYLRKILLNMCIDIEHALKTFLLSSIEDNPDEDGYDIVEKFLNVYPEVLSSIEEKADTVFTGALIEKYFSLCSVYNSSSIRPGLKTRIMDCDCPVWVLVEIIGFGSLIKLMQFYNKTYPNNRIKVPNSNILSPIKSLRNACAHNNCLLNNLNTGSTHPTSEITQYVSKIGTIGKMERMNKLSCRPIFEIVCLLKVYSEVVSEKVRDLGFRQLSKFVNGRMQKHIDYFDTNPVIKTSFEFLKKVLDNFTNSVYNI